MSDSFKQTDVQEIEAGGTRKYIIRIPNPFSDPKGFYFGVLGQKTLQIRFNCANAIVSGTGTLSLISANLLIQGRYLNVSEYDTFHKEFLNKKWRFFQMEHNDLAAPINFTPTGDVKIELDNLRDQTAIFGVTAIRADPSTSGTPGVNAVLTVTPVANPNAGLYHIQWIDPITKQSSISQPIVHNSPAANIELNLLQLSSWRAGGKVTVSGPLSGGAITFTFSGSYAEQPIPHTSLVILVGTLNVTGTPVNGITTLVTTAGVKRLAAFEFAELGPNAQIQFKTRDGKICIWKC